ncbi:hypothetical protein ACLOJK_026633 [Asimina triloba]
MNVLSPSHVCYLTTSRRLEPSLPLAKTPPKPRFSPGPGPTCAFQSLLPRHVEGPFQKLPHPPPSHRRFSPTTTCRHKNPDHWKVRPHEIRISRDFPCISSLFRLLPRL